ncbi:hypothetical protein JRO89_XS11G0169000 [Xanthoceras sorbifolium]|uniref:CHORD domain-containing protein n=1 Tax=Xanthoceras sorbifolium TaxID=99658 RepID=A0ABQ8HFX7_9ROSI|nr:hypothetical protein JRO89_XS11G0169000 [Xanthoceras sorbifolium]
MENPLQKQQEAVRVRCQRIGCDAMFTEDENLEGSCTFHDSPIFHDGMKEWSCCKKRSHDFSLFLEIPGKPVVAGDLIRCKTGKHTTEKPVLKKAVATPKAPVAATSQAPASSTSLKESCSRCRQGFFCSDHGSQAKSLNHSAAVVPAENNVEVQVTPVPVKKIVDINEPQTCRNKGCGKTFKEKDNHETACSYHPGPAVFHDRRRGWKCCDIHVKEFDEFVSIPPCTKGWHDANPGS